MKRKNLIFLLILVFWSGMFFGVNRAIASNVTLAWDSNTDVVAGYKIYWGLSSRNYTTVINVGNVTQYTLTDLPDNEPTIYFAATAYDSAGNESDYSEELVTHLIFSSAGQGGIIIPEGIVFTTHGFEKTFEIVPNQGYRIKDLLIDGVSIGIFASYTFTNILSSHSIEVIFEPISFTISASAGLGGSISPAGDVIVNYGASQSFVIVPNEHYHVTDVIVDGVSIGAVTNYTFSNVVDNHSINAFFAIDVFSLNIEQTGTGVGTISKNPNQTSYSYGSIVQLTAMAATNSNFFGWSGDTTGAVNPVSIIMDSNKNITANFSLKTFTLSATANENGNITPSGNVALNYGSDQTFIIMPNPDCFIVDIVVDGQSQGALESYTFSNITANHSISAIFSVNPRPPVADAGPDQIINEQVSVTLHGQNSSDPDGDIVSYYWEQIINANNSIVVLTDPTASITNFIAPDVGPSGEALVFKLTVTDNANLSSSDTCIVNVSWVNQPPIANAGVDQIVNEGTIINLDASTSSDPDDGIVSYQWSQISGTPVEIVNANMAQASFVAPNLALESETLGFRVIVTDAGGLKSNDDCLINVLWVNQPPVANAGIDQTILSGAITTLNATASSDPDDGIFSYQWSQISGMPVTLSNPMAVNPTFQAPIISSNASLLVFFVTVTDMGGLKSSDECIVTVGGRDLTGSWLSLTRYVNSKGKPGTQGAFTVVNNGIFSAGFFTVKIYYSADAIFSSSDKQITSTTIGSLGAGQSKNINVEALLPSANPCYIIVRIDTGNAVVETNESNNTVINYLP